MILHGNPAVMFSDTAGRAETPPEPVRIIKWRKEQNEQTKT